MSEPENDAPEHRTYHLVSCEVFTREMCAAIVCACAPGAIAARLGKPARQATLVTAGVLFVSFGALTALHFGQMRVQQTEIEEGVRKHIGLWLKERLQPGESVYLEPLGYIGWYSGAKMLDYPGLVAPEVVAARRAGKGSDHPDVIKQLWPTYLVLRPHEVNRVGKDPEVRNAYDRVYDVDATAKLDSYPDLPGKSFLAYDSRFYVFKKK